jgi:hypothetical protein
VSRSVFSHRRRPWQLLADSFGRADSTTNLGATDGAGLLDPKTWTQSSDGTGTGVWGISTNQAYTSTVISGTTIGSVDHAPFTDVVVGVRPSSASGPGTGAMGVVARYSDINNYYYAYEALTGTFFGYVQSGTNHLVTGGSVTKPAVLCLECNGNTVTATSGFFGPALLTAGSSPLTITQTFNNTATKCGLLHIGTSGDIRFDDLAVYAF